MSCPYSHSSVILLWRFITLMLFPSHITMATVITTTSAHPYRHNLFGLHNTFYPCHWVFDFQLRERGEIQHFLRAVILRFSALYLILIDWMTRHSIKTSECICSMNSNSDIKTSECIFNVTYIWDPICAACVNIPQYIGSLQPYTTDNSDNCVP